MQVLNLLRIKVIVHLLSGALQRFPFLWKSAVRIYEIPRFVPKRHKYSRGSLSTSKQFKAQQYSIVFDAQCLQTLTRQRGIGKYSLNLISSICKKRPHQLFAAVLTNIATKADLEKAILLLEDLDCPNLDVLVLNPFLEESKVSFSRARQTLQSQLESMGCRGLIALSPFEKHKSVITLPFSSAYKQIGILYDLIRLQYPRVFLFSRNQKSSYLWSLENLAKFDLLFAISRETETQWHRFGYPDTNIRVIHGGGFMGQPRQNKGFSDRTGILCISSEQPHKNLARLIESYTLLPEHIQFEHSLTILGIRSSGARRRFVKLSKKAAGKVIFKNYLEEEELIVEYLSARLLVMPSLVEGLSLPILEAWSNGLVVIGSKGSVAEELIENESFLFDPTNSSAMAKSMTLFLTSETHWQEAFEVSRLSALHFTWDATASLVLNAIEGSIDD